MYFLYVDESGDTGIVNSPSSFYILSGIVVHELEWHNTLEKIIDFRRCLRKDFGLKLREEIHAMNFIHNPGATARIPKYRRLRILREVLDFEASLSSISILNVVVDKSGKSAAYDVFENAWKVLLQRLHNTAENRNFPGPKKQDRSWDRHH